MLTKLLRAAFAALLLCAGAANAVPLEAYGRLPSLSMVTLSPDGSSIAYVKAGETKRWIVVQKLGVSTPLATMDVGDQKLRRIEWADDAHIIITTSSYTLPKGYVGKRSEWYVPQVLDLAKGTQYNLIRGGSGYVMFNQGGGASDIRIIGGHTIVFASAYYYPDPDRRKGDIGLFRVDLTDGTIRLASRKTDTGGNWIVDENGKVLGVEQYFESAESWRLLIYRDDGHDLTLDVKADIDTPGIAGLSEDGKAIIMQLPGDVAERPLYDRVSLADGSRTPWRRDQELYGVGTNERTGRVEFAGHTVEKTDYIFFDQHDAAVWQAVKVAFKDATNVALESWSEDHSKFVVSVFGPSFGNGYYFLDMTTHKASPIGLEYEGITQIYEEKWIAYKAADGREIHAYLTLPAGKDPKNLPLLVLPHGGPQSRDRPGFDFLSQAFASLGYVVLQPEFRGSTGFGKDLFWAGFGEIGKKMQTDLSDGVRALAAQGVIDPKRVCIAGWSYGGYAALAGATLDTGVYRCAISGAGVSEWRKITRDLRAGSKWENPSVRFWKRFLGVEDISDSKIDAVNPVNFADRITIPVLLIHGKEDTTVPFEQSVFMFNAMNSAGKPVEFIRLEGEDHYMSKGVTRLQTLKAVADFLLKNNPPN